MPGHQTSLMPVNNGPCLYDENALIDLDSQKVQGYLILLTGAAAPMATSETGKISKQAIMLGFSALTDGNVVDACFGLSNPKSTSAQGKKSVQEVKSALGAASDSSDAIPRIAVTAYSKAFRTLLNHQGEVKKLNFITRCFFYGGIVKKAKAEIEEDFVPLKEALAAAL